ncbi:Endothelial Protein C Receptor [Manis pentadactyla]|nr:Endothelial Protein C Receptor [Manis pentadactyla]
MLRPHHKEKQSFPDRDKEFLGGDHPPAGGKLHSDRAQKEPGSLTTKSASVPAHHTSGFRLHMNSHTHGVYRISAIFSNEIPV